jgi:hypothetical protein
MHQVVIHRRNLVAVDDREDRSSGIPGLELRLYRYKGVTGTYLLKCCTKLCGDCTKPSSSATVSCSCNGRRDVTACSLKVW